MAELRRITRLERIECLQTTLELLTRLQARGKDDLDEAVQCIRKALGIELNSATGVRLRCWGLRV
jgi:hypothetical protein